MQNAEVSVDFSRGKWDPSEWIVFKSLRFDYAHAFVQKDDHIENPCPEGVSDEDLYANHVTEVYASIVHPKRLEGSTIEVSSTMSFDHLMAPLIVITPELDADDQGRPAFKKHIEVVLYNEGINVWRYDWIDGKAKWTLAAFLRAPFEAKRKYELAVTVEAYKDTRRMTVECGGRTFGYSDDALQLSYWAGITGCEGRNRFYDFSVEEGLPAHDNASDGEH